MKRFTIQGRWDAETHKYLKEWSIPWGMLEPMEMRALKNHGQSLARLNQRGGVSAMEALAILNDLPLQKARIDEGVAAEMLEHRAKLWEAAKLWQDTH
jgi:hypothetical protein